MNKDYRSRAKLPVIPLRRKLAVWSILTACAFALMYCEDRIAGSSVTTGNPTEIQVSFTGDGGAATAIAGRVEIYAATQVPVPGFQPAPLAKFKVDGETEFTLKAESFEGVADSLWPIGSFAQDTLGAFNLRRFNVIVLGVNKGAVIRDLTLNLKTREFELKGTSLTQATGRSAKLKAELSDLIEHRGFVEPSQLASDRLNFLFSPGTGYVAKSKDGQFLFPSIPSGRHVISYISLPDSTHPTSPEDSAEVWTVGKELQVGSQSDTVRISGLAFRLPLPDLYKP